MDNLTQDYKGDARERANDQAQLRASNDEPNREDATGALAAAPLFGAAVGSENPWHTKTLPVNIGPMIWAEVRKW